MLKQGFLFKRIVDNFFIPGRQKFYYFTIFHGGLENITDRNRLKLKRFGARFILLELLLCTAVPGYKNLPSI